jgi:hypothetical protein
MASATTRIDAALRRAWRPLPHRGFVLARGIAKATPEC